MINKIWNVLTNIIYKVLNGIYHLFHKELSDEAFQSFMQFVKFGIVGVSNTLISYFIYLGTLVCLNNVNSTGKYNYLIASVVSFILSVLWSFYWNNKYVFKKDDNEERSLFKTLIKTYISYSFTGLFLNNILLILWVQVLHVSEFIAPLVNLIISVPLNFLINKFWAFKSK